MRSDTAYARIGKKAVLTFSGIRRLHLLARDRGMVRSPVVHWRRSSTRTESKNLDLAPLVPRLHRAAKEMFAAGLTLAKKAALGIA